MKKNLLLIMAIVVFALSTSGVSFAEKESVEGKGSTQMKPVDSIRDLPPELRKHLKIQGNSLSAGEGITLEQSSSNSFRLMSPSGVFGGSRLFACHCANKPDKNHKCGLKITAGGTVAKCTGPGCCKMYN